MDNRARRPSSVLSITKNAVIRSEAESKDLQFGMLIYALNSLEHHTSATPFLSRTKSTYPPCAVFPPSITICAPVM